MQNGSRKGSQLVLNLQTSQIHHIADLAPSAPLSTRHTVVSKKNKPFIKITGESGSKELSMLQSYENSFQKHSLEPPSNDQKTGSIGIVDEASPSRNEKTASNKPSATKKMATLANETTGGKMKKVSVTGPNKVGVSPILPIKSINNKVAGNVRSSKAFPSKPVSQAQSTLAAFNKIQAL